MNLKVFLFSLFAVFLIPLSAFASTNSLVLQPNEKVVFKVDSSLSSGDLGVGFYSSVTLKWRTFSPETGQTIYPTSSDWSTTSGSFFLYVHSNKYLEVWNDTDQAITLSNIALDNYVVYEKKTDPIQSVKDLPTMMVKVLKDGGLLSLALTIFAVLLAVGLIPRLKSWFLPS